MIGSVKRWFFAAALAVTAALSLIPFPAAANPASPYPVSIQQPDGTSFTAFIRGDEYQGWVETEEGYTVVQRESTRAWEYSVTDANGALVPSGVVVIPGVAPPREIPAHLMPPRMLSPAASIAQAGNWDPVPISGQKKVIIILVNFANRTLVTSASGWNTTTFSTTPGQKSLANYYNDNSFGIMTVQPVSHTQSGNPAGLVTVTVSQNHPNCGGNFNYSTEIAWINSALSAASSYVNFAALDSNGNGTLEQSEVAIYFVLAGYERSGTTKTPNIWAHAWGGSGVSVQGKQVTRWALNGELNDSGVQHPMGVICHELGHSLCGLPDLYDTSYTNAGLGIFSMMAAGSWGATYSDADMGMTPVGLDAWSRQYLGWSTPRTSAAGEVSFPAALSSPDASFKLANSSLSSVEYFLVENRYPTGWDEGMEVILGPDWGGGLLIQHVDISVGTPEYNDINCYVSGGHQGVMAEEASSAHCTLLGDCYGDVTNLFYSGNNADFTETGTPNSSLYSGTATNLSVTNISARAQTMTATIDTSSDWSCSDDVPKNIDDLATIESRLFVDGVALVADVDVKLNITHTYDEDMQVQLIAPDGTAVELFSGVGGSGDNFASTVFDDSAETDIADGTAPFRGSFRPSQPLSSLSGKSAVGWWKLRIKDNSWRDTGRLTGWCLQFGSECKPTMPMFSPDGDTYFTPQSITIDCETPDAVIHYTTDGSIPTCESTVYTAPVTVDESMTLQAIACQSDCGSSDVKTAIYTLKVATPSFSPDGGAYLGSQSVTITCDTSDAIIHYTTDGTEPTCDSPTYTTPVPLETTTTIRAIACKEGYESSTVKTALYSLGEPPVNVEMSPISGLLVPGVKQVFTCRYSHPGGYANITECRLLINNTFSEANAIYVRYLATVNKLYIRNRAGTGWIGGIVPGTASVIQTDTGQLICEETSVSGSGTDLTVAFCVKPKSYIPGISCTAWMLARAYTDLYNEWTPTGVFGLDQSPVNVNVTPSSGTIAVGTKQIFNCEYSDTNGSFDLAECCLLINTSKTQSNAVYAKYNCNQKKLYLRNDAGTGWLGGFISGSDNVIENSSCKLYCAKSGPTASGTSLMVNFQLQFKSSMSGKNCKSWLRVTDDHGLVRDLEEKGTLTIQ